MSQLADSVVLLSGGMDSTTAFWQALGETNVLATLSFDYGQRHKNELGYAARLSEDQGVPNVVIDMTSIGKLLQGSALSDPTVKVPDGHYAEETMKQTIVPNRNMIMLSQAAGAAIGIKATEVWAAMHSGDHFIYPDCRPEFINHMNVILPIATETDVHIVAPFINISKADIVKLGGSSGLGVPYEQTWSCYKGGNVHCGRCGTCVERAEAFYLANEVDPTLYKDPDYWKEAVEAHG